MPASGGAFVGVEQREDAAVAGARDLGPVERARGEATRGERAKMLAGGTEAAIHEAVVGGFASMKAATRGATWRRPKPAGAESRRWPAARTPPSPGYTGRSSRTRSLRVRIEYDQPIRSAITVAGIRG